MPKLGLSLSLPRATVGGQPSDIITLYSDTMDASASSFQDRQFFSSVSALLVGYAEDGKVSVGTNYTESVSSGNSNHLIHYFDSGRDTVPTYLGEAGGIGYGPVYGGYYGHCQYTRTVLGAGGGSGGYYPNYAAQKQATDTTPNDDNGWTRVRPSTRPLNQGNATIVNFSFKPVSPGSIGSNNFRFGMFKSSVITPFTAADNKGSGASSTNYVDYRGYVSAFGLSSGGSGAQKLHSRTTTESSILITTLSGIYTDLSAGSNIPTMTTDVLYNCSLKIVRPPSSNSILVLSTFTPATTGVTQKMSYVDNSPLLNHETYGWGSPDAFVAYAAGDSCTSFELSNVSAYFAPSVFINSIVLASGSVTALNGTYIRTGSGGTFARVGGGATIYFSVDTWYLYSDGTFLAAGNAATNTSSDLVSASWVAAAPGNSSGIVATYGCNV